MNEKPSLMTGLGNGGVVMSKLKWHNEKRVLADLIPYEYNPRQLSKEQYENLKKSLEKFSLAEVPVINTDNTICAGHQRIRILLELYGKDHAIDVRVPSRKLTQKEFEEYNIRSNKNTGDWDWDKLANEFEIEDLTDWGFTDVELQFFDDEQASGLTDDDEVPEVEDAITKTGDLWLLGSHRLLCGDSTKKEDVGKLMNSAKADMVFTSPPYNMAGDMYRNYDDNLKSQEYIDFNINVILNIRKYLRGYLFWNISYNKNAKWEWIEIFYRITKDTGLRFLEKIVWDKGHGIPITSTKYLTRQYEDILLAGTETAIENDLVEAYLGTTEKKHAFNKKTKKGITNYWRITTGYTQLSNHSACYPVALPVKAILLLTNINEVILDPFLGSGSTLIACEKTNRKCYGMEIDPHYCDVIVKRWEEFTGKKAQRNEHK